MPDTVRDSIYEAIASIRLIDPHTHINPHAPASSTLADLLGYHYYTELAHSAGMPKQEIEQEGVPPRELVGRLVSNLSPLENTAQYRWLVEICRMFFGFDGDRIDSSNWEEVYDSAERQMSLADWPQMVLDQSNVEAVFLTNDFDDELSGFDADTYIPCLRTDDLVFHLPKLETRQRLAGCSGVELDGSLNSLRDSLNQRFEYFVSRGARACAISLPPSFQPAPVSDGRAATALSEVLQNGPQADPAHQAALSRRIFWTLAELCDQHHLPFDLMIGVNRGVYAEGVFQGQDLYDSRVSLIQYRELFNSFPGVKFPVSVLASVTNQELVSYAWIFPNVMTNGHWWYSNTPSFIARDAAARLEAVPQTKQIAYYSDAYKLEFVWPKFDMYRRVLASILANHFVKECGWSEERAIELGRQVLRDNVDEIFPRPAAEAPANAALAETWDEVSEAIEPDTEAADQAQPGWGDSATAGTSAALAAGAIGMVEVEEAAPTQPDPSEAEQPEPSETPELASTPLEPETPSFEEIAAAADGETPEPAELDSQEEESIDDTLPLETVRMNELAEGSGIDLDPLPSDDEIQSVDVDDVQLLDNAAELGATDADAIEADAEPEPLDVGDLLGEDEVNEQPGEQIRMLRGEESFEPDEDSLQLRPDPLTGELTFQVPSAPAPSSTDPSSTDQSQTPADEREDEDLILEVNDDAIDHLTADSTESSSHEESIDEDLAEIDLEEMNSDDNEKDDYLNS